MYIFSKIAIALISPLGTALALALLALVLGAWGWRRLAMGLGGTAFVWLWLWSTPVASNWLIGETEARYPAVPVQALPQAQALVVLGGGMRAATWAQPLPGMSAAADRVWHAARLYHAGKAPLLVLSGGNNPRANLTSEAVAMRVLLHDLGVPDGAMLLEHKSRTTQENARFTAALLKQRGIDHILLVTSASHMRRAIFHFEEAGLRVTPAATDHELIVGWGVLGWMPDAGALEASGRDLKERVGLLVHTTQTQH
jgi:uncharacterized SAM-binding protein YcdF (DUF218 family)